MIVNEQIVISTVLVAFDLAGTFVFALSGEPAGVKHKLDLFGVLVFRSLPVTRVESHVM